MEQVRLEPNDQRYYGVAQHLPVVSRISLHVRRKMFAFFMEALRPTPATTVLDVGVTSDQQHIESNFFEHLYPHKTQLTCAGAEDARHLERTFPGLKFVAIAPGQRLPFADGAFDMVFSNAVVEHAGGAAGQRYFISELLRVARSFFIATPNRWFPVELHTCLPLLHFLPPRAYRRILRALGLSQWAREEDLNLLDAASLRRLFPADVAELRLKRIRLGGLCSNLVAYGQGKR